MADDESLRPSAPQENSVSSAKSESQQEGSAQTGTELAAAFALPDMQDSPPSNNRERKDGWDKADIIGKLASGIVLALLALFVKCGTDDNSNSLKKGELVQKLIEDLASEQGSSMRRDIALIALHRSVGSSSQDNKLVVEVAEKIVEERGYGLTEGNVAFLIIRERDPERAAQLERKAFSLATTLLKSDPDAAPPMVTPTPPPSGTPVPTATPTVRPSPSPTARVSPTPTATPPGVTGQPVESMDKQLFVAKVLSSVIFIQYANQSQKSLVEQLRQELIGRGYSVPELELKSGRYRSSVRYFNQDDRALAEEVERAVRDFLATRNVTRSFEIQDFSGSKLRSPVRQVEVWISF